MKLATTFPPRLAGRERIPRSIRSFEARKLLERLAGTKPLNELVRQSAGIFHAGRSARRWLGLPEYGVPFLSSTDILEADFSFLPLMAKSAIVDNPSAFRVERGLDPHALLHRGPDGLADVSQA